LPNRDIVLFEAGCMRSGEQLGHVVQEIAQALLNDKDLRRYTSLCRSISSGTDNLKLG
jgi:hypothetical protein